MAAYQIGLTEDAKGDLYYYDAFERKKIADALRAQLGHEPLIETRNRKRLRDNPISPWELRAGEYRIFYGVDETARKVIVAAIGHKVHNALFIRGKQVTL
jgi:mRNA-degrading endonuclease RelE of RelBE toxin-antitoxin system